MIRPIDSFVRSVGFWSRQNASVLSVAVLLVGIAVVVGVVWFSAGPSEAASLAQVMSVAAMAVTAFYAKRAIEASIAANRASAMPYVLTTVKADHQASAISILFSNIREAPAFGLRLAVLLEYQDQTFPAEQMRAVVGGPIDPPDGEGIYCASGVRFVDTLASGQVGWREQPVPRLPSGVRTHAIYFDAFGAKYEQFGRFECQVNGDYDSSLLVPVAPLETDPPGLELEAWWFEAHARSGLSLLDFDTETVRQYPRSVR